MPQLPRCTRLPWPGIARQDESIGPSNPVVGLRPSLAEDTPGQDLGPPGGELAVEQHQGLERVGAGLASRTGALGIGCIEGVEERVAHVPLAEQVERSPQVLGGVGILGPEVDDLGLGEDEVFDLLLQGLKAFS